MSSHRRMTRKEVLARVEEIRSCASDSEQAHQLADGLYLSVLRTIAEYGGHPGALARTVLHVEEIEFARWFS